MRKYNQINEMKPIKKSNHKQKINLSDSKKLTPKGSAWLAAKYVILIGIAVAILYPIIYLIISSFNKNLPSTSLSTDKDFAFSTDHFKHLSKTRYWKWLSSSIAIGWLSMVIVVLFTGFMAYGFSRYMFKGKKSWIIFVMVIGLVPNVVALIVFYLIATVLQNSFSIPNIVTILLLYTGGGIVGNLYILKSYIDGISRELDDSGKIDGLTNWQIFIKLIVPLAKPMLAITAFWSFLAPFNDFILSAIILTDPENYTIALGMLSLINGTDPNIVSYPAFAAGALIISIPIVTIFLVLQRYIRKGLAAGAVK